MAGHRQNLLFPHLPVRPGNTQHTSISGLSLSLRIRCITLRALRVLYEGSGTPSIFLIVAVVRVGGGDDGGARLSNRLALWLAQCRRKSPLEREGEREREGGRERERERIYS